MGIFDSSFFNSANDLLNKSASKVSNALDSASNKMKLAEQQRKRAEACAALGAAVYAESKDDAEFRAKYDELFTAVESVDEAIAEIEAQISAGEAQKAAAAAAAADATGAHVCGNCGAAIAEGALFCGNCGTKVPEPEPVSASQNEDATPTGQSGATASPIETPAVDLVCPSCAEIVPADADFCPSCGAKL